MTIDLPSLKQAAERATKGPWFTQGDPWDRSETHDTAILAGDQDPHMGTPIADCNLTMEWDEDDEDPHGTDRRNATYIAAANPAVILELIRQHGAMREALEKSCICGEFGFIDGKKCPACKALEDCE